MKTQQEQVSEKDQQIGMRIYYINLMDEMERYPKRNYTFDEVGQLLKKVFDITDIEIQTIDT